MIRVLFIFGFALAFLGSCTSKSVDAKEKANNDSIQKYLDLAGSDTLNFKLRNKYNDIAFSLINLIKNDSSSRFYLCYVSHNYRVIGNIKSFKKIGKLYLQKSIKAKDTVNIARYYRLNATYFKMLNRNDSAFYYYLKSERFFKKTKDKKALSSVYYSKSLIQIELDDYLGAERSCNLAYVYCDKNKLSNFKFEIIILQGVISHNLRNYGIAIEKYKECIDELEKSDFKGKDLRMKNTCLNNIGNAYREQKKFSRAIPYFKTILEDKSLKNDDCELYAMGLNNIGYCYLQLNHCKELPDLFFRARKILDSIGNKNEVAVSNLFISEFYFKNKDTLKAIEYAERALILAKEAKAPYYYLTALTNAGIVDKRKASNYIREYHEKNDSLLFIERNARNQYYKIQLETNDIIHQKEIAIKQKWIVGVISGVIILIVILILIITRQKAKQKELTLRQEQQKTNEEIYDLMLDQKNKENQAKENEKKRIAIELHDGVMNKLASTRLNLDVLNHKKDPYTIEECLVYISQIYQIEQEIRNISHDLSHDDFNSDNSFVSLVNDFIIMQNNISKVKYKLEMDQSINWEIISSSIKMNLFRIIQEASHNINKFSNAKTAIISFLIDKHNICLSITDDGKGFDTEINSDGIGLKNIKQRVESLKGKFVIQSVKNRSTSLNVAIPIL